MPVSTTINGKLYTPIDEHGDRKEVLFHTTVNNVIDPVSGKNILEFLNDQRYAPATATKDGLLSASMFNTINNLSGNEIVISRNRPNKDCLWMEITDEVTV
jgi:hypothetical protein|nr:MAG TPA: hypothetical protein [Caudoviricetes sp.]